MSEATAAHEAIVQIEPIPGVAKPNPILVIDGVRRSFGGVAAVDIDHLEIERGIITALIGPNGAGKTTLFNLLTGYDKPERGTWTFQGQRLTGKRPDQVARAGMVRTFQLTRALAKLTVLENVMLGATGQVGEHIPAALFSWRWRAQEEEVEARAIELLRRFNLLHMKDDLAGTLSGGQRKLLEMARALMVNPTLVMLDEPMAGVNPALRQSLLGHITHLRSEGMTVVFVEHDMDTVMTISDWIVVLAQGRVIAEGPPSAVAANELVIEAYLGRARGHAPASDGRSAGP